MFLVGQSEAAHRAGSSSRFLQAPGWSSERSADTSGVVISLRTFILTLTRDAKRCAISRRVGRRTSTTHVQDHPYPSTSSSPAGEVPDLLVRAAELLRRCVGLPGNRKGRSADAENGVLVELTRRRRREVEGAAVLPLPRCCLHGAVMRSPFLLLDAALVVVQYTRSVWWSR